MKKPSRRSHFKATSPSCIEVQQLEPKQLLTGVVSVSVSSAGDVSIVGDNADNEVYVAVNAGTISVVGLNGTSIKAGNQTATEATVPRPASIRDLKVSLKGGDDVLNVALWSAVIVDRHISVDTGSGDDLVAITSENSRLVRVRGDVNINTGNGSDAVAIVDNVKVGQASTPTEVRAIANDSRTRLSQVIRVGNDININTGDNDDAVLLGGVEAFRDINIQSGFGNGDVLGVSNVRAGRNMKLTWGDANALRNVTVAGKLSVDSGTGDDSFLVENLAAREVSVNLGSGSDTLAIGTGVRANVSAKISGGSGSDNIVSLSAIAGAKISSFEGDTVDADAILDDVLTGLLDAGLV